MADVTAPPAASTDAPTPKKAAKKEKKTTSRPKASHLTTAVMVNSAIQSLKERGGSSLQAIKKYITATYKIDTEKLSPFIKKYIKSSVASGSLVQTKGKGASGSFKLASDTVTVARKTATKKAKKPAAKAPVEPKATPAEKPAASKRITMKVQNLNRKPVAEKKKHTPRVAKPKTPSKVKKTAKAASKKPKSPKPKTTKAKPAGRTAKKASPKKK